MVLLTGSSTLRVRKSWELTTTQSSIMIGNGMEMPRAYPEYHALNVVTALNKREKLGSEEAIIYEERRRDTRAVVRTVTTRRKAITKTMLKIKRTACYLFDGM